MNIDKTAWDNLTLPEQAAMMKVAVNHGIYNLQEIKAKYNEYAMGGDKDDDEQQKSIPSLSEAKRLGVLIGAVPFARPKTYIGGNREQTWDKYWQTDTEMNMLTDSIAKSYDINPDLLRYRLNHEGYTDARVKEINKDYKNGTSNALLGEALFKSPAPPKAASDEFGLDDTATYINNGSVGLINESWGDGDFINEHGRVTNIAIGDKYSDNMGIMAATLKYFRDLARKDFPNASEADLDRYAVAYYNRGPKGGKDWVKRGAKGYNIKRYGGPLIEAFENEMAGGGSIHIKPSHRGRLTELKKRTGKTEAELYKTGSAATRKMITFARNARKWKHGDGGPLVNLFYPGGTITYGKPFYSYDENGNKVDDTLNYNGLLSDIIIIPDNQKSPADRNEDERYRQRTQNDYAEQKSRDYTKKQIIAAQKDWENSIEKRVLDYAQAAASGIGIGADIVSGLPIYSSLRGAKVLSEAEAPMDYVEGGLWLSPLIGGVYQTAKPMTKQAVKEIATAWDLKNPQVPEGFLDITPKIEQSNAKSVFAEKPVTTAETVKAGERGRNKLINRASSDWYTHRWEEAAPFENTDIVINDIINDVKDAPIDYSLSKYQLDPSGLTYGKTYAIQLNPDKITLPDGTIVSDYNTGLGIKVAADIGENAENTAMHELIHYSTGNSYGLSSGTVKPTMGGLLDPVGYKYDLLNPKQIIIPRGKRYQHFMVDYNESLLPKEDPKSIYNLIINNPSEAERKLIDTGLTVKEAKKKIQEMLPDAEYYTNKQEQQTFLKTWFFDKVVPKLKDPNNASEIEKYLLEHPETIQKDYYVNTLMNTVRPGSTKQYAKALSKMLSTIYAASKIKDLTTE